MSTRPVAPVTFLAPVAAPAKTARPATAVVSDYVDGAGSRVVNYADGSSITKTRNGRTLVRGGHRSAAGRADAAKGGLQRVEVKGETAKMWAFGAPAGARFTRG